MYPKFIEVHDRAGNVGSINVDHLISFMDREITLSNQPDDKGIGITETYDELKVLIRDAGCIIAKKDPRLDDNQLTMEQLQQMIGEPVWNSNLRVWHLVREYLGGSIILSYCSGNSISYTENDLDKFPLYRMKVTK